jgi:mRNA interferase MazF
MARVKRGEIWTVAAGSGYLGKPRPAVIVQDDRFDATASVTVCAFTSDETEAPLVRLLILPSANNGLDTPSRLMVDKLTTVAKEKLGRRLGRLDREDLVRLDRSIVVFLGLGG